VTEPPADSVHPATLEQWREWLAAHHAESAGVWLVTYKRATGKPRVEYEAAVEEALCWAWIDSVSRSLDNERTLLRFTPRKKGSVWARSNKERVARLEASGRLQPVALQGIAEAQRDGSWTRYDDADNGVVPDDLKAAFVPQPGASEHFAAFPPGEQRRILAWIAGAKTAPTRARRVSEAALWCHKNVRIDNWKRKENAQ
jgi:uncharacterized protein YdeI (YjbR/CyaY-like superfamily)